MNKLRYAEKKYLCQYDLDIDLFNCFNIVVNDLIPSRSVYLLFTDKGKKILKMLDCDSEVFNFIIDSLEFIRPNYSNIVKFNKTIEGNYILNKNGNDYVLMDLIEGRESNFSNPIDISITSKALGKFNLASKGILKNLNKKYSKYILNYEERFEDYIKNIDELYNRVLGFKYKNEFDNLFINTYERFRKYMENGICNLKKYEYRKHLGNEDELVFLHQDLINHNVIIKDEEAHFIDFDYACLGLKMQDMRNLIMRVLKSSAYDKEKLARVLEEYEKIEKLKGYEKNILYSILEFPVEYCSIVEAYYYKKKQWDEEVFINRFKSKLEFVDERDKLIKELFRE